MAELVWSSHARDMIQERNLAEEFIQRAIEHANAIQTPADGTIHYLYAAVEFEGRVLHVVVNPLVDPPRIVTFFFDRRLRGKL